jgi:ubiquinone biosynthesis protein
MPTAPDDHPPDQPADGLAAGGRPGPVDPPGPVRSDHLTSFNEPAPWPLDLDHLAWRRGLGAVRQLARAQVPDLVRSRRLPPLRRLARTTLVLGLAVLPWVLTERRRGGSSSRRDISRRLRRAFERLGPSYIKLGQVISSGEGILPDELVSEFRTLRDRVPAESFETVRAVVEADLGRPLKEVFAHFDGEPVAAASIAQVHLATLVTGEPVAVKVQRPGIDRLVAEDLAVMTWLAPPLTRRIDLLKLVNLPAVIELFAETVVEELDFRLEAENMLDVALVLDRTGQRAIAVPRPHPTLVTRRVLVMERMSGFAFDDVDGIRAAHVDTAAVVRACLISLLEGAMIFGVFHGDLHGGNLFIQLDGRVALLDYGITGRLEPARRLVFLRMLLAAMVGDHRSVLAGYQQLGAIAPDADLDAFLADIPVDRPPIDPGEVDADQMIAEMRRVTKALVRYGTRLPKELMLFMKDFLFIDAAMTTLAPDLDVVSEMLHISEYFLNNHGAQIAHEIGLDASAIRLDPEILRGALGLPTDGSTDTHREIRQARQDVRRKVEESRRRP